MAKTSSPRRARTNSSPSAWPDIMLPSLRSRIGNPFLKSGLFVSGVSAMICLPSRFRHYARCWLSSNGHLDREYFAVLETDNAIPYYLNLHEREVAHTLILGATGFGKTMKSLEAGHSEVITQYLGTMARFHTYSFGNVEAPRRSSAS